MWRKIIWSRSGGYWLFYTGLVYFIAGMIDLFVYKFMATETLQAIWVLVLSLPLWIKPLARWLNMRTIWEMFK